MKIQISLISGLIFSLLMFSGCKSEEENGPVLQSEINDLKQIEERSENIQTSEDAFTVLRDLNQTLKDIREGTLAMEDEYREVAENEKRKLESQFEDASKEIDRSLKVISSNIQPYKDDEKVSKMMEKLNEIMISK